MESGAKTVPFFAGGKFFVVIAGKVRYNGGSLTAGRGHMKLNYKRTIFVGFAFFLICTFWNAYDTIIPKILTDKFGMSQANSGIIMALDNVLALFMLPLFGTISDKCRHRLGRRTPFILYGTIVAAVLLVVLSFVDNRQLKNIEAVAKIDASMTPRRTRPSRPPTASRWSWASGSPRTSSPPSPPSGWTPTRARPPRIRTT